MKQAAKGVQNDLDIDAASLKQLCEQYKVVTSRSSPATTFRRMSTSSFRMPSRPCSSPGTTTAPSCTASEKISDDLGTAVNIQAMVFGNMGEDCGTGVAFTRDPSNGDNHVFGEYLMNAQGEDVVAGVRTPMPISELETQNPAIYKEFADTCHTLGAALQGHAGYRVHYRARQAVYPAVPLRQAHRPFGGEDRRRHGGRTASLPRKSRSPVINPSCSTSACTRSSSRAPSST